MASTAPFEQELSFREKVNAWRQEHFGENCEDASITYVVAQFNEIWNKKQVLEERIKEECNVALRALSEIGVEILKSENIDKVNVNGEPVWIKDKTYFSILGKKDSPEKLENVAKLRAWMEKNDMLDCYTVTLPHKRLEGIVRDELRQGRAMPDGVKMTPDFVLCVNKREPGRAEREED